jgi:hypothetical protein
MTVAGCTGRDCESPYGADFLGVEQSLVDVGVDEYMGDSGAFGAFVGPHEIGAHVDVVKRCLPKDFTFGAISFVRVGEVAWYERGECVTVVAHVGAVAHSNVQHTCRVAVASVEVVEDVVHQAGSMFERHRRPRSPSGWVRPGCGAVAHAAGLLRFRVISKRPPGCRCGWRPGSGPHRRGDTAHACRT